MPKLEEIYKYIIDITAEIWEGRGLDKIRDYYAKDVVIHTPGGDIKGVEKTIQNTAEMLSVFPDRRLLPHDIIASYYGDKSFSSHRIISIMHHRGQGIYGYASGRRVKVYTIADCLMDKNNQIYREWLVRDHLAIVKQLGLDPFEFAVKLADLGAKTKSPPKEKISNGFKLPAAMQEGGLKDLPDEARRQVDTYISAIKQIRCNDIGKIADIYHEACTIFLPGAVVDYGHSGVERFFLSYAAAFPQAEFSIRQITANRQKHTPLRIATRWTLSGLHKGSGKFGKPSGKRVNILGITHSNIYKGKVIAEWNLIDEIAIWSQTI